MTSRWPGKWSMWQTSPGATQYTLKDITKEKVRSHDENKVLDDVKHLTSRGTWRDRIQYNIEGGIRNWKPYMRPIPGDMKRSSRDGFTKRLPFPCSPASLQILLCRGSQQTAEKGKGTQKEGKQGNTESDLEGYSGYEQQEEKGQDLQRMSHLTLSEDEDNQNIAVNCKLGRKYKS